jgi:hypothetical protein
VMALAFLLVAGSQRRLRTALASDVRRTDRGGELAPAPEERPELESQTR